MVRNVALTTCLCTTLCIAEGYSCYYVVLAVLRYRSRNLTRLYAAMVTQRTRKDIP